MAVANSSNGRGENHFILSGFFSSACSPHSSKFTPIIEISEGATITPASGVEQDFSNNKKVTYTVMAEDGTVKVYTAFVEGTRSVLKYSFEEWKEGTKNDELLPKDLCQIFQ